MPKAMERGWGEATKKGGKPPKKIPKLHPQSRQPEAELQHRRFGGTPTPQRSAMPTDSPSPEAFKISDKDGAGEGAGGEAIK